MEEIQWVLSFQSAKSKQASKKRTFIFLVERHFRIESDDSFEGVQDDRLGVVDDMFC